MEQTTYYKLNLPSGEDYYNIEHQNENMRALDDALETRICAGVYTGDGEEERVISLPRTPKFVLIAREGSRIEHSDSYYGGLAVAGSPARTINHEYVYLEVVEGGFRLTHRPDIEGDGFTHIRINTAGDTYHYLWG